VVVISEASIEDADAILVLQRLAYQSEARLYDDWSLSPLTQTLESLHEEFVTTLVLKATDDGRLVGSVRARVTGGACAIGRLIVHPDFQRQGIGSRLLQEVEARFPDSGKFELFTGNKSEDNLRLYQGRGYRIARTERLSAAVTLVYLEKPGAVVASPAST
jgi:ribosomal protein S18 acetylase RimI-like enzyme